MNIKCLPIYEEINSILNFFSDVKSYFYAEARASYSFYLEVKVRPYSSLHSTIVFSSSVFYHLLTLEVPIIAFFFQEKSYIKWQLLITYNPQFGVAYLAKTWIIFPINGIFPLNISFLVIKSNITKVLSVNK